MKFSICRKGRMPISHECTCIFFIQVFTNQFDNQWFTVISDLYPGNEIMNHVVTQLMRGLLNCFIKGESNSDLSAVCVFIW